MPRESAKPLEEDCKESRMKFIGATKLQRESAGVWHPLICGGGDQTFCTLDGAAGVLFFVRQGSA
jgi:hypothetical protein